MSGEQIQVREGWWRQRCGDVVHVTRDKDSPVRIRTHYPWNCKSYNYTDSGRMDSVEECDVDLVEFLHDNETLEIWNSDSKGVTLTECLNLLCEYAERNLPEDWTIVVKFGRNESTIELINPDGEDIDDSDAKSFDDYCDVANAIHRRANHSSPVTTDDLAVSDYYEAVRQRVPWMVSVEHIEGLIEGYRRCGVMVWQAAEQIKLIFGGGNGQTE